MMAHKKLVNAVNLEGQREEISMMDFRKAPGDVLTQAMLGKVFVITRNGRPVATLGPHEPSAIELGAAARRAGIVR